MRQAEEASAPDTAGHCGPRTVLAIRLGALGDVVQSFPAFAALRAAHPSARLDLLTTAPFAALLRRSPWFDSVLVDRRPPPWALVELLRLRRRLRGYDRIYDLQTSSRSSRYFTLAGKPEWSGIARGCRFPHANPQRNAMHTVDRQREQLAMAGVAPVRPVSLGWLSDSALPPLPAPYAVLVPGAAPHRPAKRWPAAGFAEVGRALAQRGLGLAVVGTRPDAPFAATIAAANPGVLDLCGRTDLPGLAAVLAGASVVLGNDTGPMHLAAALGRPCLVLFSAESDPALCAPRDPDGADRIRLLRRPSLDALCVTEVLSALPDWEAGATSGG